LDRKIRGPQRRGIRDLHVTVGSIKGESGTDHPDSVRRGATLQAAVVGAGDVVGIALGRPPTNDAAGKLGASRRPTTNGGKPAENDQKSHPKFEIKSLAADDHVESCVFLKLSRRLCQPNPKIV